MERYLIIDPIGINLPVEPVNEPLITPQSEASYSALTVTGENISGSSEPRFNFTFVCHLPKPQADQLKALADQQLREGRRNEIVIYFLWDTLTDTETQQRQHVPDLAPTLDSGTVNYYPVIQGDVEVVNTLLGLRDNKPLYRCQVSFTEGTIRRP